MWVKHHIYFVSFFSALFSVSAPVQLWNKENTSWSYIFGCGSHWRSVAVFGSGKHCSAL